MAVPPHQLIKKPTDSWSIREKLALASSVERTRDQNWVSVSRQIKPFAETNRPQDWFSQKNCALQYGALLEDVEHPKRKRGEEIATPGSIIVKNLVQERIQELEQLLKDGHEKHEKLERELALLKDERTDDEKIETMVDELNRDLENEARQEEEYEKWLKERELEAERQRQLRLQMSAMKTKKQVRTISDASDLSHSDDSNLIGAPESPLPPPPSSSLLTTLLRSPTQSPNQSPRTSHGSVQPLAAGAQSVSHQRLSTESQNSGSNTPVLTPTGSTSMQAPTLSKLLEQPLTTSPAQSVSSPSVLPDEKTQVKQLQQQLQLPAAVKQELILEDNVKREPVFQETLSAIEDVTNRLQEPQNMSPMDPNLARAVDAVQEVDVGDENIISVIEQLQEDMQRKEELRKEEQQRNQLMAMQQMQEGVSSSVTDANTVAQTDPLRPPLLEPAVPFEPPPVATPKTTGQITPTSQTALPSPTGKFQQALPQVQLQQQSAPLLPPPSPQQEQQQPQQAFEVPKEKEQPLLGTEIPQLQVPEEQQPQDQAHAQLKVETVEDELESLVQKGQPQPQSQQQPQQEQHEPQPQVSPENVKTQQAQPSQARQEPQAKTQTPIQQTTAAAAAATAVALKQTKVSVVSEKAAEQRPSQLQAARRRDSEQKSKSEHDPAIESSKTSSLKQASTSSTSNVAATDERFPQSCIKSQPSNDSQISKVPDGAKEIKIEKKEELPTAVKVESTPERTETRRSSSSAFATGEASGQECHEAPIYEEHVASNAEVDTDPFSQNTKDGLPEQDEMIEEEVSEEEIAQDQDHELDIKNTAPLESQAAVPAVKTAKEPTPDKERDIDRERDQKIWKKSALLVWRTAANHSNANVFMNPVPEDMAPGYDDIVFKPMDLATIKRNIENGVIKTTMELLRDMMLMFQNAIMYNSADHDVYHMAIEMQDDVVRQIEELMANEASERSGGAHPPEGVKRPARHRHSDLDISSKKPRRSTGFGFK